MRERFLVSALEPIADDYDVCVLDCPPNLGLLTVNALVAADRILVPVRMEDEGALQGVIELRGTLVKLASRGLKRQIDGSSERSWTIAAACTTCWTPAWPPRISSR